MSVFGVGELIFCDFEGGGIGRFLLHREEP